MPIRLNSSKQDQAPEVSKPVKNWDICSDAISSLQLYTAHALPRALTVSQTVFVLSVSVDPESST
jgi:hypothetical protein